MVPVVPSEGEKGSPVAPTGYKAKKGVLIARFATVSKRRLPASVNTERIVLGDWSEGTIPCSIRTQSLPSVLGLVHRSKMFGVDFRKLKGWVVTHIPTGYAVNMHMKFTLRQAKHYAESLLRAGGEGFWNHSDSLHFQGLRIGRRQRKLFQAMSELANYAKENY